MVIHTSSFIHQIDETSFKLEVKQPIVSLNQFLPSKKSMDHCKKKYESGSLTVKQWEYLCGVYSRYKTSWAKALTIVPMMERRESISHTEIISDRSRLIDLENLWGGAKPIRDTLERRGWIYNDSPKWSTLNITQRKVKKGEEKTWIKITLDTT